MDATAHPRPIGRAIDAMIISASYRTDIPAFYADWFNRRLDAGFCEVRNPYSAKIARLPLSADAVDGFVFWTRRLSPFMATLDRLHERGTPFVIQFTVTGYPRALEPAVIPWMSAVKDIHAAAARFGPRVVVWRYDPVFLSALTPPSFHVTRVTALSDLLAGHVDEVVFSFAHIYRKSRRNVDRAASRHGFSWSDPEARRKQDLLQALGAIAAQRGLRPTLCSQPALQAPPLSPARCIDAGRLADVAGRTINARTKGNRDGCLCAESRDIGAYDTCPHGCVYCYAVSGQDTAKRRFRKADPDATVLGAAG